MNEPAHFANGKAFHTLIARYHHYEEQIDSERMLTKANGRTGRADIFLWIKPDYSDAVVIESKWTDWDRLQSRGTLRRNLHAHRRQVWSYLDGTISLQRGMTGERIVLPNIDRQAALFYPKTPRSAHVRTSIEEELGEWGITTIWFDDPPPSDSLGGKAWAALQSGEIPTDDLCGSADWDDYLLQLRRPLPVR